MNSIDKIHLNKIAKVKKLPSGEYRVLSKKNKNLGTYSNKFDAFKRLKQIEMFKHMDKSKSDDKAVIDLTSIDEFAYSAIMRELNKKASSKAIKLFVRLYKINFDGALHKDLQKPDRVALQKTISQLSKKFKIKLNKNLVKNAAVSELGSPEQVGAYLSNIIKFILKRISPMNRGKSLLNIRQKIFTLNELEIANKNMPASAAIGQSLTFVKHVLFGHDAKYIRSVLNNVVRNL